MVSSGLELQLVDAARRDPAVRRDLQNMAYANTALLFLLFYDHFLTLRSEMKVIWPMPLRLPKVLFLINRYLVSMFLIFHNFTYVFFNINDDVCIAKLWTGLPCIFSLTCVEGLLMFRVEALYGGNKRVQQLLYISFGAQILATGILSAVIMPRVHGYSGADFLPGCLYIMPPHMELIWLPGAIFEALLAVMTIYKACLVGLYSPLLTTLVRDGFIYFFAIFTCLLVSLIYPIYGQRFLAPPLLLPSTIIASLGTARITINLRRSAARDQADVQPPSERVQIHIRNPTMPLFYRAPYASEGIKIEINHFVEQDKTPSSHHSEDRTSQETNFEAKV